MDLFLRKTRLESYIPLSPRPPTQRSLRFHFLVYFVRFVDCCKNGEEITKDAKYTTHGEARKHLCLSVSICGSFFRALWFSFVSDSLLDPVCFGLKPLVVGGRIEIDKHRRRIDLDLLNLARVVVDERVESFIGSQAKYLFRQPKRKNRRMSALPFVHRDHDLARRAPPGRNDLVEDQRIEQWMIGRHQQPAVILIRLMALL